MMLPDSTYPYPTTVTLRTSDKALAAHFVRAIRTKSKTVKWADAKWVIQYIAYSPVSAYPQCVNFLIEIVFPLKVVEPKKRKRGHR